MEIRCRFNAYFSWVEYFIESDDALLLFWLSILLTHRILLILLTNHSLQGDHYTNIVRFYLFSLSPASIVNTKSQISLWLGWLCNYRRDLIIEKQSPLQESHYWLNREYPSIQSSLAEVIELRKGVICIWVAYKRRGYESTLLY